ncbi:MAG: M3 family oligoendopeptidase [Tepidisphaera sp.]|nr:M3 family oligoendopeptidase [Tepidisphaera sp.]
MTQTSRAEGFVPPTLDAASFEELSPLIQELLGRTLASTSELERWLHDRSDLLAAISEGRARLYIASTCNTDDQAAQEAYASYVEHVAPKLSPMFFELDKKLVQAARVCPLPPRYAVLLRNAQADVELFRPENVPLETDLAKLGQQYDQIVGAMTVEFDGQTRTLPQMSVFQESPDRTIRERAWRTVADRRLHDHAAISDVFDRMISLRHKVGVNAGFESYVGYAYKSFHRFDYGPAQCERFHAGVEAAFVPLMRELDKDRAAKLHLPALRPWDLGVDVLGRGPLKPFDGGADLVAKSRVVFRRLDPRLAALFEQLGDGRGRVRSAADPGGAKLDLDSRRGKAPGGYQYMLERSRVPFIFMNAAGVHKDVQTMVHEAGHAFHSMLCVDEPLVEYRSSPIEFAEVASMSMELLTMKHLGPGEAGRAFYDDPESLRRACRDQLKRAVTVLPWIATIDAYQHWLYANPTHTRDQRAAFWLSLDERFGSKLDWSGLDQARRLSWQRQMHLFSHPFYYIEYGIAQLGALQLWLHSLEKSETSAIEHYIKALSLGGSRPLPELFKAAGLVFDFGPETLMRLADRVRLELAKFPE